MPNFPGPYELEFEINMGALIPARNHKLRINVALVSPVPAGSLLTSAIVKKTGGGSANGQVVADQFWSYIRQCYAASVTCTSVTLWKYVSGTYAKDFVSAGAVALPAGTAGAVTLAHQCTCSFRSANGSVLKIVMLESNLTMETSTTLIPNSAGTQIPKLAAYILSADNVALARDDAYPVAALKVSGGQNEKIWRKIYRGT